MLRSLLVVVLFVLAAASGCGRDPSADRPPRVDTTDTRSRDLYRLIARTQDLTRFADLLRRAGMDTLLMRDGPFTVFAPTNSAIAASGLRLDTLSSAAAQDSLQRLMRLHLVRGRIEPASFRDTTRVASLLDIPVRLERRGRAMRVGTGPVVRVITAGNGLVYVTGRMLLLPRPKRDTTQADSAAATPPRRP